MPQHKLKFMEHSNQSTPARFILLGLSNVPPLQFICFFAFFLIYTITILGNILLITVVVMTPSLHTPMYFFLSNLSVIDITFSCTIVPKILVNTLSTDKSISFVECAIQMYIHLVLGATESILLAAMAYDRFVAICRPLHYTTIMNYRFCACLVAISWVTVVILYYGTIMFIYLRPYSTYFKNADKIVSLLYTTVTPMLNPFIYSMRNKDFKGSINNLNKQLTLQSL
ncbi:olfactory receptor 2G3-like [Bufo gargarizans]|uniref:olfactory receptor 2G3-like n=1 Tax=Bufo gargarizans TaxID=30331 RepID=UPI001CF58F5F|nr:olfactory receptor 2G3-like [Bufo gargarizans]